MMNVGRIPAGWWIGLVLAALTSIPRAADGRTVLVSTRGQARLSEGTLTVAARSSAQLLVADTLLLGVDGPAKVRLGSPGGRARLDSGERLRLAGGGTVDLPGGQRIETSADCVAVVVGRDLWVLSGSARVQAARRRAPASAPTSGPTSRPGVEPVVIAGQRAALGLRQKVEIVKEALPERHRLVGLSHGEPDPWKPPSLSVGAIAQTDRVVQIVRRSRQAAREMASCGCTEGSDSSAPGVTDSQPTTALEKRNATIRLRVRGVPLRDDK